MVPETFNKLTFNKLYDENMSSITRLENSAMGYSIVIDDDDRVVYAYLLQDERIISDVWLYNWGPAPAEPEWRDPSKMPFANPKGYSSESALSPTIESEHVKAVWIQDGSGLNRVDLFINDELFAVLKPGAKPGWCRNASKNGPLATMLESAN